MFSWRTRENYPKIKSKYPSYLFYCVFLFRFRTFAIRRVQQAEKNYQTLSKSHQEHIPSYLDHLDIVRACIDHNYEIIKLIIKDAENVFENKKQEEIEVSAQCKIK